MPGGLVPALRVLDEPAPEVSSALLSAHRPRTEPDHVHAIRDIRYPLSVRPENVDSRCAVGGWHDNQVVRRVSLAAEPIAPGLAMLPLLPTGGSQQLALGTVELGVPARVGSCPFGHAGQRCPHRPGERSAFVDGLEELDLSAVEVGNDGTVGPAPGDRVVLRRQVMKMEDMGAVCPCGTKRCLPDRRQVVGEIGGHG